MGDLYVDRLYLLELGRDAAKSVANLIARQWHVLAFNVGDVHKNVVSSVAWDDETVPFAPAERSNFSFLDGIAHCPV